MVRGRVVLVVNTEAKRVNGRLHAVVPAVFCCDALFGTEERRDDATYAGSQPSIIATGSVTTVPAGPKWL